MRTFTALDSQAFTAVGWALLYSLWQGCVIAMALAGVNLIIRPPRIRYGAAMFALTAAFTCFVLTLYHFLPGAGGTLSGTASIVLPHANQTTSLHGHLDNEFSLDRFVPLLAPLWLIGVCLSSLRLGVGWISAQTMTRFSIREAPISWQRAIDNFAGELKISKVVRLLESMRTDAPVVLGHFKPIVLVPIGFFTMMSPQDVEAILLHELAHIRRCDYLLNIAQRMVEAVMFYHPAVWWISRLIRVEREHCCDDVVVAMQGAPLNYAVALTNLEQLRIENRLTDGSFALGVKGGNLMNRVERLLTPGRSGSMGAPAFGAFAMTILAAVALSAWHLSPPLNPTPTLPESWQKWLEQDVVYIISDDEKTAFERLNSDEERRAFVEQFWLRRDSTPGTTVNEYKNEHYRRIAYANEHWGLISAGWRTDRGRIYIRYGPPDEIDSHPNGGKYEGSIPDGGAGVTYPFEDWVYAHFQGVGRLNVEFVDAKGNGDFRMTLDLKEKYRKP